MLLASLLAFYLSSALQAFQILLQIGAGTGLLFILRWFWWRINAVSELTAMVISFVVALIMEFAVGDAWPSHLRLVAGVGITTVVWISATLVSRPSDMPTLIRFYNTIRPHAQGWQPVIRAGIASGDIPAGRLAIGRLSIDIAMMVLGCFLVYGLLFGIGSWIYGELRGALVWFAMSLISMGGLRYFWRHNR